MIIKTHDKRRRSSGPSMPGVGPAPVCRVTAVELRIGVGRWPTGLVERTRRLA
jgi:hypothetical protein